MVNKEHVYIHLCIGHSWMYELRFLWKLSVITLSIVNVLYDILSRISALYFDVFQSFCKKVLNLCYVVCICMYVCPFFFRDYFSMHFYFVAGQQ